MQITDLPQGKTWNSVGFFDDGRRMTLCSSRVLSSFSALFAEFELFVIQLGFEFSDGSPPLWFTISEEAPLIFPSWRCKKVPSKSSLPMVTRRLSPSVPATLELPVISSLAMLVITVLAYFNDAQRQATRCQCGHPPSYQRTHGGCPCLQPGPLLSLHHCSLHDLGGGTLSVTAITEDWYWWQRLVRRRLSRAGGYSARGTCGAAEAGKWGSYCGGRICLIVVSLMQFQASDFLIFFSSTAKSDICPFLHVKLLAVSLDLS